MGKSSSSVSGSQLVLVYSLLGIPLLITLSIIGYLLHGYGVL